MDTKNHGVSYLDLCFFSRKHISESTNPAYKSSFHSLHARHLEISWDFGLLNHHMFCHPVMKICSEVVSRES